MKNNKELEDIVKKANLDKEDAENLGINIYTSDDEDEKEKVVERLRPEWSEIIAEYFPQGWVHIAHKKGDNRKMLKLKDNKHHFAKVTLDYIQGIYK